MAGLATTLRTGGSPAPRRDPRPERDCLEVIRERLPGLRGTGRAVAVYLIAHAWEARGLTITELADAAGVSPNALTRFSRLLGYSGYRALMHELALSLGQAGARSFAVPDEAMPSEEALGAPALVRRMFDLETRCLRDTADQLSDTLVERAVSVLASARRVAFGGMGGAAQIAQLGAFRMLMLGLEAHWSADPYVTLANASVLQKGDVAFGISHSGQSRLTIEFLGYARDRGATTIALTAVPGSPITAVADVVLAVFGPVGTLSPGLQRFASRVSGMVLVEAIVAAVATRRAGADVSDVETTRARFQQTLEPPIVYPRRARTKP